MTGGSSGNIDRLGGRIGFEFGRDDVVQGKQQLEMLLRCVREYLASEVEFILLNQGFADGDALRFQEGVSHSAADEHGIGNFHEIFDDFDFVADFRTAENGDERPGGIGDGFADVLEFFFHQQTGRGFIHKARDAHNGSVRAMRGAESVANEKAVAIGGEGF